MQPEVGSFTRVCSYDRAGFAWSDAGPLPRTMAQIVRELHTALGNAGEKPPFVLVGAALGGAIVRVYANTYPNEVAGMVLVDAIHEDQFTFVAGKALRLRETSEKRHVPESQSEGRGAEEPLVYRNVKASAFLSANPRTKLPAESQRIWMIARKQAKYREAANSEFTYLPEEMDALCRATSSNPHPLGAKPLTVLTADLETGRAAGGMTVEALETTRKELQSRLAKLSTKGQLVVVKNTGHEIELFRPEVVISAIRDIVQATGH